jgi:tRNA A37 N6-isopentenylltransferase MiaA
MLMVVGNLDSFPLQNYPVLLGGTVALIKLVGQNLTPKPAKPAEMQQREKNELTTKQDVCSL